MCVSFSGVCRMKLCGYATFIVNADSAVSCVCWRHFLLCPQEERRRIGIPMARARVWDHLSFAILFFCVSALFGFAICSIFLSRRSPWSLAWTNVHRLSKALHSHCKKRPNGLCSNSSRDASTTSSWSDNPTAQANAYPINNKTPTLISGKTRDDF